jgi:DNA invertase Pin-like site-specific DNA recombinase
MQNDKSRLIQAVRAVRNEIHAAVKEHLSDESRTYAAIAESVGVSLATVQRIAQREGITRPVGPRPQLSVSGVSDGNK